ncbi:pyridoxal-phosphate-dependent aminotransferase family protein [Silicimonas sp. MF1-12-2]|uniref:pyridoxal-phosphate-dependent aminotransferase family protein n=1 Tax=Silicimonas sp. MF1-12-2 TaxID=3384793 RepID=UPI0039B3D686
MSLGNGRTYLAIPGPSVMPERVIRAMMRAAPNIYHGELPDMMPDLIRDLKSVARTRHNAAIYICNGHGAWEAAAANVLSPGDKVLVASTGRFSHGWAEVARSLGIEPEILEFGLRSPIDPERVKERLAADTEGRIRAVTVVQTDTSTSVRSDVPAIRRAIDAAGHDALLMVDSIACLGCDVMEMDAWGVDVLVTASQKGLMTPPGLGFVFYNDKADRWREAVKSVSYYWDWRPRTEPDYFYRYFAGTAPTHLLYALREALDMIAEEGLEQIWWRHGILAQAVWAAFEHWGEEGPLELNAPDRSFRSHAVTGVRVGSDKATELRNWCENQAGLTLGIGLGMEPTDHFFRLGHMGHVNAQMVLGALATIEAGLKTVGIPHARGGAEAAGEVIARNTSP